MIPLALFALIAQLAAGPAPAETTDVDETTTAAEASPLAPDEAATPAPEARSLDDILSAAPYEPPAPAAVPDEQPRPGVVLSTPGPTSGAPTFLGDLGSKPDGPPTASDSLYESRVLGAFRATEAGLGPLDGRWLVAQPGGGPLYALQFADPGGGRPIEGAWRDMTAPGRPVTGFIDSVERGDAETVVKFQDSVTATPAEVRIHATPDGGWVGQALTASGPTAVVMTRDQGVELVAQSAPIYVPPKVVAKPAAKKRAKAKTTKSKKATVSKAKAKPAAKPKAKAPAKKK